MVYIYKAMAIYFFGVSERVVLIKELLAAAIYAPDHQWATGTLSLTLSALKHLGLRQRVGGWTHIALVSIASSESWMLKRGKRLCPIPKSTLLVATAKVDNGIKLLNLVTFDFIPIKLFKLVRNFSKCLLKLIDQLQPHIRNELIKQNCRVS